MKPSVGRIVHYHPGTNPVNKLPNGMTVAAAIVTQVFETSTSATSTEYPLCNLTVFLAQTDTNTKQAVIQLWSVMHKSQVSSPEMPYWDWPPRES